MIGIFKNFDEDNLSYDEVVDWIRYYDHEIKFFTGADFLEGKTPWSIEISTTKDEVNKYPGIKSIWFRGFLRHRAFYRKICLDASTTNDNVAELRHRVSVEIRKITKQLFPLFDAAYQLPRIKNISIDKLTVLRQAKNLGIKVPPSIITNNKNDLLHFMGIHGSTITKSLYETVYFQEIDHILFYKTSLINANELEVIPDFFSPRCSRNILKKK